MTVEDDWKEQISEAISTRDELVAHLELTDGEEQWFAEHPETGFPFQVTPYYLSLIDPGDPRDPVRLQCIPQAPEFADEDFQLEDSLAEDRHTVAPYLIRRYPDRALLTVTNRCATYCRHCTRRRQVGRGGRHAQEKLEPAFRWLEEHDDVSELIISGGDPLVAPDGWIRNLIKRLDKIAHLEVIRLGTRTPVTLPQRITPGLCKILSNTKPLYLLTHFNHPRELTEIACRALESLVRSGLIVVNQAVLLRGVNDCSKTQMELCRKLHRLRVRPYYLMQCDAVVGTAHLRTSIEQGLRIMATLRARLSGLAIPTYVLDLPGGLGKVPLYPKSIDGVSGKHLRIRSPSGAQAFYPDSKPPVQGCAECVCSEK